MVFYDFKLGKYAIKLTPLEAEEKIYDDCDEQGNVLKRVSGTFTKGYFLNSKGEKIEKAFKLINGKPTAEFKTRMKENERYLEVSQDEVNDLIAEKYYLAECPELYDDLTKTGKALKFGYNGGRGYKAYRSYIFPSKLFKGFLEVVCGRGQKSEKIKEIVGELTEKREQEKVLKELELTLQKVNRVAVEEMITI